MGPVACEGRMIFETFVGVALSLTLGALAFLVVKAGEK